MNHVIKYISEHLNKETEKKIHMTQKKTLTYTFHYWGAFCQGAFVQGLISGSLCPGVFCPRPNNNNIIKKEVKNLQNVVHQ